MALLLLAAACSGGGGKGRTDSVKVLQEAADRTISARTARIVFSVSTPPAEGRAEPLTINGDGVFDFQHRRGRLTFDVPTTKPPQRVESVIVASAVYAKLPREMLPLAGGARPWVKLPAQAATSRAGLGVRGLESADLAQALRYVRGATSNVKRVGTDRMRDTTTTHYRGPLDLEVAAANTKEPARTSTRRLIETLGTSRVPADIWLDNEHRIRKLVLAPVQVTLSVELFDFGTPVKIDLPPPEQVSDLTSVLGQ